MMQLEGITETECNANIQTMQQEEAWLRTERLEENL